jgi:hypothetical protein
MIAIIIENPGIVKAKTVDLQGPYRYNRMVLIITDGVQ